MHEFKQYAWEVCQTTDIYKTRLCGGYLLTLNAEEHFAKEVAHFKVTCPKVS